MLKTQIPKRFWIGLFAILLIYSAYWVLLAENKQAALHIPKVLRYFLKMGVVFAVYFTGTYFLGQLPQKWLLQLWHIIHITLISILIGLWIWHFGVGLLPLNLVRLGYSIHEFLISPLLYLGTGLLGTLVEQRDHPNKL
jgi:hypothetical protein